MENAAVNAQLEQLEGQGKQWATEFVEWMRKHYPALEEVVSFQMPTYKLGSGANRNYISFNVAKNHFSLHTMDFDYINLLREKLKRPGKGKGCVQVMFDDQEGKQILLDAIAELVARAENVTE